VRLGVFLKCDPGREDRTAVAANRRSLYCHRLTLRAPARETQ
jgi:hypothetical protein